ncbi:hypothetical protein SNE25_20575 [Mucilaginibacter sabulilitoris]|uniref:Uncharacterized protein n=1 Tax=Mucilaginibacter sabulilitoris TaxID=1173583 RepID=A0ABZ0TH36_9SPHI|nr:hypothetical protein [Mucilaginibacter sabulilitoris]WPU91717.1 hypothetical protein SNE25_20575 [Mucilaginibacter sabulilitoris]
MRLLTQEEIANIEVRAQSMQELRKENYFAIGGTLTAIMNLSPANGLILIGGNEDTGFEHIRLRHELYSGRTYWRNDDPDLVKLDYPSKFGPTSIPVFSYVELADALYKAEFYKASSNNEPDLFDVYDGMPEIISAENRRFKLVLYKGTKIIHTLYPTNAKYTVKKPSGFALHKGGVSVQYNTMTGLVTVTIPYFDHLKVKCYSAIHSYDHVSHKLHKKILIHRTGKADLIINYRAESFEGKLDDGGFVKMQFEAANLKDLETELVRIEADKENWINQP